MYSYRSITFLITCYTAIKELHFRRDDTAMDAALFIFLFQRLAFDDGVNLETINKAKSMSKSLPKNAVEIAEPFQC